MPYFADSLFISASYRSWTDTRYGGACRRAPCGARGLKPITTVSPIASAMSRPVRGATRPAIMGQVLSIVYRCLATHLIRKAGFSRSTAQTGAVTLIQRFGSALNLNSHFHMLFLDGVYADLPDGSTRFHWVKAPTSAELAQLAHSIANRVGRYLER